MSEMQIKIKDNPIQPYYLPKEKTNIHERNSEVNFQQLLQQKINMAMNLNGSIDSANKESPLASSLLPNFISVMNGLSPVPFSPQQPINFDYYLNSNDAFIDRNASNYAWLRETPGNSTKQFNNPTKYNDIIREAAEKYHVDEKLIHAIIKMESNYNPTAKSHAGAAGLMQLMPATARYLGISDRYDVRQNIFGGTKYISQMLRDHNGDLRLALAAYNAGPGNVKKYGGIPPFKETQNYVRKVLDFYQA